jgi:hypothetical protein
VASSWFAAHKEIAMQKMVALTYLGLLSTITSASPANAANGLFASRVTYPAGVIDMEITISASEKRVQAEVRVAGVAQLSLVETTEFAEVINHQKQVAIRIDKQSADSETSWQNTNRHQFALGGYCQVVLASSTVTPQELCVVPASQILAGYDIADTTLYLGGFLAAINSANSVDDIYANALFALQRPAKSGLPLIVRNLDRIAQREMRFKIAQLERSSDALYKSRKLRRISLAEALSSVANINTQR